MAMAVAGVTVALAISRLYAAVVGVIIVIGLVGFVLALVTLFSALTPPPNGARRGRVTRL